MTKLYCFVVLLFLSFSVTAQIPKNSTLLGGQLNYSNYKGEIDNLNRKSEYGALGLSVGRAFRENSVFGVTFNYLPNRQSNEFFGNDTTDSKSNRFDFGVFYRGYKQIAKDFYIFAQ